jgi:hypothetical protein
MVSSAVRSLTPWLAAEPAALPGATASTLSNTVCRMAPAPPLPRPTPAVAQAVAHLVAQSMALRSPTAGWPVNLPQTAENLALYLSEETWELLESLDVPLAAGDNLPGAIVPIADLVPHLLWMLASGGYELMRLIEGVQARVHRPDTPGAIHIVRLVPVLVLTVADTAYALDLVTQTAPVPPLYLDDATELRLLENDLDSQSLVCGELLGQIADLVRHTQPGLGRFLAEGCDVDILRPFQPWQSGTLCLHLHLAEMESQIQIQPLTGESSAAPDALLLPPGGQGGHAAGFTLDDFASTVELPADATAGVLGDWLTFTDEGWIQTFLASCAQRVLIQHLPALEQGGAEAQETLCNQVTYAATDLVQGANGLFKHTFVHEPVLVADVWPRLRWYLAQSSERVMQLMGGVAAQVLPPGLSWQQGSLYLRPLMQITAANRTWIIDLSRGRLLPTAPLALPADAAVDVADDPWRTPLTVADLTDLIAHDLDTYTPAIAALRQGTTIHLHRLDGESGCQPGQLTLTWCFTLQTTL